MSDNIASSILTEHGVEAHEVDRRNNSYKGSLAVLYDKTWTSQNALSVFALADIVRDTREEDRTSETIPEKACALGWGVKGEVPYVLFFPFGCRGIFVRDEYRKMLSRIFYAFGEGFGARAGYAPDERIEDTELFPPHNPFMGLDVKLVRQKDIICGLIITGTSGIGKTLFLLYVLALRLLARQTTVLQLKKNEFIIFEAAGVFSCEKMNAGIRFLPEHTWFLVDSNREIIEPPDLFLEACFLSSRRLIVAASPREQRFDFTSKYGWIVTKWMYPFESWEYIAARYFQLTDIPPTERQLQLFFREWGPNARAAFEYVTRLEEYKREVIQSILRVRWEGLSSTIRRMSSGYFYTDFSHKTLIVKPSGNARSDFYVEFASKSVADLVIKTFRRMEEQKAQELYRFFLESPKARAAAGHLLEAIAMISFQKGGVWQMQSMKKSEKRGHGQSTKAAWVHDPAAAEYTLLIGYEGSPVTIMRTADYSPGEGNFAEVARVDVRSKDAMTMKGVMYVPKYANHPTFDAWIFNPQNGNMVAIQFTCQMSPHDLNSKGFDWFDRPEVKSLDVIIVSDERGGKKVEAVTENVEKIQNVYRLIM